MNTNIIFVQDLYLKWKFGDVILDKYDTPKQQVSLELSGAKKESVDLGAFNNCSQFVPELSEIPVTALIYFKCWWAGAGDIVWVELEKPNQLVVKRQEKEEADTQIPVEIIKSIEIPKDVKIVTQD